MAASKKKKKSGYESWEKDAGGLSSSKRVLPQKRTFGQSSEMNLTGGWKCQNFLDIVLADISFLVS